MKTIFKKCGICGKSVKDNDRIAIRLDDNEFGECWQRYHPKCYGSMFHGIPQTKSKNILKVSSE